MQITYIKDLYLPNFSQLFMAETCIGTPVFIAPLDERFNITVTDTQETATKWGYEDTTTHKIEYHQAYTGYIGLHFEMV